MRFQYYIVSRLDFDPPFVTSGSTGTSSMSPTQHWQNDDYDARSDSSCSGVDPLMTPTSSTKDRPSHTKPEKIDDYARSIPQPGKTYVIYHRRTNKVITLVEGALELQSVADEKPGGGWYWTCVEKNGWLGFRNHVSGTYLGHDARGGFHAKVMHHKTHEYFCVRRDPRGGYTIFVKHGQGDELWRMSCDEDASSLVESKSEGEQWKFQEVLASTRVGK